MMSGEHFLHVSICFADARVGLSWAVKILCSALDDKSANSPTFDPNRTRHGKMNNHA